METKQDKKIGFRCVLHGSFRKHFEEIKRIHRLFSQNGIEVLAPAMSEIKTRDGGFAVLASDAGKDRRMTELLYLHNLKRLGENGVSYFVNPEGYIGRSASYELGIAQVSNVRCFFKDKPADHPVYVQENAVIGPERLVEFIFENRKLPEPHVKRDERAIHKL